MYLYAYVYVRLNMILGMKIDYIIIANRESSFTSSTVYDFIGGSKLTTEQLYVNVSHKLYNKCQQIERALIISN